MKPETMRKSFIGSATDGATGDSAVISAAIWNATAANEFGEKQILSLPVSGPDGITPQNPHVTDGIDIDFPVDADAFRDGAL